ncbi:MAG TPA: transglutaminase family protein [Chthoniobacterales bacterium]|jgi:transglutaminase-like putative cysteine protease
MHLRIHSHTRYEYEKPASFSPHLVRLFPRQESFIRILETNFTTSEGAVVNHRRDLFDNQIARCFFPEKGKILDFDVRLDVILEERSAFDFLIDSHAVQFPFTYLPAEQHVLSPYLIQPEEEKATASDFWKLEKDMPTLDALLELNRTIFANIRYERREEGEAMLPAETLNVGVGACRDFSRLAASLLRSAGVAVRLVSGYVAEFGKAEEDRRAEGSLHAWIEAYIPGAGWLGMDPTNGVLCDHHFIPAAVGLHPDDISPTAGRYYGNEFIPSQLTSSLTIDPVA